MKYITLAPVLGALILSACATSQPPRELVEARAAYNHASSSGGSRLALVDLHNARQDLDRAEASFRDDPNSNQTRDLAYVAWRHAQTAEARGDTLQAEQDRQRAEAERGRLTNERLAQTESALAQAQQSQSQTAQQLAAEREARMAAERQAQQAMASLREVASVREEQRGTIITLSGEVLFAPGASALLPIAQQRLDQVAVALRDQGGRRLRIEGYTDSRGSSTTNQQLSQMRAMAVRDYLVSRGLPAEQIEAVGLGPTNPVADNTTPEGRANNRRVEIVVMPPQAVASR